MVVTFLRFRFWMSEPIPLFVSHIHTSAKRVHDNDSYGSPLCHKNLRTKKFTVQHKLTGFVKVHNYAVSQKYINTMKRATKTFFI